MRVHYFQHVIFEGPARLSHWVSTLGYTATITRFFDDAYTIPNVDEYDILIILGGPMSVNDDAGYPWLTQEMAAIRSAIDKNKQVLGICLGAQLIAKVLGATVAPAAHKEIGWYPIEFSAEAIRSPLLNGVAPAVTVLHWHGETFQMPSNTLPLASSSCCENQGFVFNNRVLALQFHLEMDADAVRSIVHNCGHELLGAEAPLSSSGAEASIQTSADIIEGCAQYAVNDILMRLLNNWIALGRHPFV